MKKNIIDLVRKNVVVYDLEIKKSISEYTHGWDSKDEMEVSVAVSFDYRNNQLQIYLQDNLNELINRLNEEGTLIIGFNQTGFDNQLLRNKIVEEQYGMVLKSDSELQNFDMLMASKIGAGYKIDDRISGFKLKNHLSVLGLGSKSGEGIDAPILWKNGKLGKLINYAVADVRAEKRLFEYIYLHEELACVAKPEKYKVELPEMLRKKKKGKTKEIVS